MTLNVDGREIKSVTIGGKEIPAIHAVCKECNILDLDTSFTYLGTQWTARCTKGHYWAFKVEPNG